MTLTIQKEEDDQRQLKLTVEVPEQRVQQAMRKKARELAGELRIPGFRPGKAPYDVIIRRFGKETIRAEAVDDMFQALFEEALTEAEVLPYAQPNMVNMELEPLVMVFNIPLEPEVQLGEYRELRKEIEPIEISDKAVEEALEQVQIRHQNVEEVDRAVQDGDLVTFAGKGTFLTPLVVAEEEVDEDDGAEAEAPVAEEAEEVVETAVIDESDEESKDVAAIEETQEEEDEEDTAVEDDEPALDIIFDEENRELLMDSEKMFPGTPFVENLVGLSVGDEKAFTLTFPDDYEDEEFSGREASFDISVLEVKNRELPPLDDDLAQLEGNYETLDEMREGLFKDLEQEAEYEAQQTLVEGMIDDLLPDATIIFPPAVVESEIDDMLESLKQQIQQIGWEYDDYLKIQGSSEEDTREEFRENATIRISRRLVLRQFLLDEKLTITEEDIDAAIDKQLIRFDSPELRESLGNYYRSGPGFDTLSSEILMDKAYERIKAILSGEAPDLAELEAESESLDEEE